MLKDMARLLSAVSSSTGPISMIARSGGAHGTFAEFAASSSLALEPGDGRMDRELCPAQVLREVHLDPWKPCHIHRFDVVTGDEQMQRVLVLAEPAAQVD